MFLSVANHGSARPVLPRVCLPRTWRRPAARRSCNRQRARSQLRSPSSSRCALPGLIPQSFIVALRICSLVIAPPIASALSSPTLCLIRTVFRTASLVVQHLFFLAVTCTAPQNRQQQAAVPIFKFTLLAAPVLVQAWAEHIYKLESSRCKGAAGGTICP